MKNKSLLFMLVVSFLITTNSFAQTNREKIIPSLKKHISTLASDEYGGREPGTKGEVLAYTYITNQFKEIGLAPKGTDNYLQEFTFVKSVFMSPTCSFTLAGKQLEAKKDFFLLPYSSEGSIVGNTLNVGFGIVSEKQQYDSYKGVRYPANSIFVMEYGTPDHAGPHTKYQDDADIRTRIDNAIKHGALGVIFINTDAEEKDPEMDYSKRITATSIPVVFVKGEAGASLKKDGVAISVKTKFDKEEGKGHNVIGFIDNKSANTVVIGAHYDDLGMGSDGSLYRGEPAIHNGADDNASGVAALIELARYLKQSNLKGNNYLIMAYSGEEKGLLGSGYFVKHPTLALENMNYMINMDMVGRLKSEEPTLLINGVGTSDFWKIAMEHITIDSLKTKTTDSGVGPSDHTSFYLNNVPVVHFFSGTHSDYHKPSDDENLINYMGEARIIDYIVQVIQKLNDKGKANFIKTKDDNNEDAPRFKVTLGVVPDYAFEGSGMRIDGITEGKPASKAGMKAGDVVTQIGEIKVLDMMSYMKALGKFNKGEKATVHFTRGKEEQTTEVEF